MLSIPYDQRVRRDPLSSADEVDRRELAAAIAWTEVYLRGLRDRLASQDGTREIVADLDLIRLDGDQDLPRCRLDTYRQALADPSPSGHPPVEPDSIDITLAEHTHQIAEAKELAASAMKRFHEMHDQLHDQDYSADDDGHFDRQGHVEESRGL